jgi:hypothetical protein
MSYALREGVPAAFIPGITAHYPPEGLKTAPYKTIFLYGRDRIVGTSGPETAITIRMENFKQSVVERQSFLVYLYYFYSYITGIIYKIKHIIYLYNPSFLKL